MPSNNPSNDRLILEGLEGEYLGLPQPLQDLMPLEPFDFTKVLINLDTNKALKNVAKVLIMQKALLRSQNGANSSLTELALEDAYLAGQIELINQLIDGLPLTK